MKSKTILVVCLLVLLILVNTLATNRFVDAEQDPMSSVSHVDLNVQSMLVKRPLQNSDGIWMPPEGTEVRSRDELSPTDSGGPDDFGYTWDDSVALNWLDATSGTDTGMSGESRGQGIGPINLPFSFKYYGNTYTSLYIAASGYLAFTEADYWDSQPDGAPSPGLPNNIVAPYGSFFNLASNGPTNRIYYKTGGTAPNRYFVAEWFQVEGVDSSHVYTFEVILYENGDIVFQYQSMVNIGYCGIAGIENLNGWDGLNYLPFCTQAPSNRAVRFFRPGSQARADTWPPYQGQLTAPGKSNFFQMPIQNTGDLGTDTFDIFVASNWSVNLFGADGTTPLTDSDSDGTVDTGTVSQGNVVTITVKVQTPPGAVTGVDNNATITARSSLNTSQNDSAVLQTAVPAPFAHVLSESKDQVMKINLVQEGGQALKNVPNIYPSGNQASVVETPNGFAYFWTRSRSVGGYFVREIEYTMLDRYGDVSRGTTRLTNHAGIAYSVMDLQPSIAVTPNGRIGVLWQIRQYNFSTGQSNYNIYFAILDADGNRLVGPLNITNNGLWGTGNTPGVPRFDEPRITATGDNRFLLAWQRTSNEPNGCTGSCYLADIFYTIKDSSGSTLKGITKFTNGIAGANGYNRPTLAALSNNRVLLSYEGTSTGGIYGLLTAILDSNGNIVRPEIYTTDNGFDYDAVQLSGGRIVLAVNDWDLNLNITVVKYVILDGSSYNVVAGPVTLTNPATVGGDFGFSVTADNNNQAVFTWGSNDFSYRAYFYYALVNSSGAIVTSPLIYYTSPYDDSFLQLNHQGYDNTTYSWIAPTGVDGWVNFNGGLFGGQPGKEAAISLDFANHGLTKAQNVVLTVTLDGDLSYAGDTSGVTPTINGNNISWSLSDLNFLERKGFQLFVSIPAGANLGDIYPISVNINSDGPEDNPGDNTTAAQVFAAKQQMLPSITKD